MRTNRALVKAIKDHEHESSSHPVFGELLNRAACDIINTEEKLVTKASLVAVDMTRLVDSFVQAKERPYFSRRGVLQDVGHGIDGLCGILDAAYENFDRIYAAWNYTILHEPDRPGGDE